jgi:hypothetical protein
MSDDDFAATAGRIIAAILLTALILASAGVSVLAFRFLLWSFT